ncbi:DUF1987 domain-containing protein [uncultured Microscilla sp.]|uniref:DUF1987 domain-containing protein n=1 Tax=uncultured Microscilla sp. TaxID=432653 RepID=UPI0026288A41|nr:DUF1987 domain-containing protein [uncultured Microscilla sp.]
MKSLIIPEGNYTPYICFDTDTNVFEVAGESYSEYTLEFFEPILSWLSDYLAQNSQSLTFNFRMNYFNTSTSRRFFEILKMLEDFYHQQNSELVVHWYAKSNDLDMIEAGEDYKDDFVTLPFHISVQKID